MGKDRFLPFAVEALGGCTETRLDGRDVVDTLAGWALQKARVYTGLREETSADGGQAARAEIGRASCRERV